MLIYIIYSSYTVEHLPDAYNTLFSYNKLKPGLNSS